MEKVGIILTARTRSERFSNKILQPFKNNMTCFEFQVTNLIKSKYPVVIAVMNEETRIKELKAVADKYNVPIFSDPEVHDEDVLGRLVSCARKFGFDHIGRVTHDDIFFDHELFEAMVDWHTKNDADHTNCPQAPRGIDSEVMRVKALELAEAHTRHLKYREHITYYLKRPPFKYIELPLDFRLALDYPEDYEVIKKIAESHDGDFSYQEIRRIFLKNPDLMALNRLPKVSVFIICKDYAKYLDKAIQSVLNQTLQDIEIILLDDGSSDNTWEIMNRYEQAKKIKNDKSVGLIKATRQVLAYCRGEYVFRLDADDWLEPNALEIMLNWLDKNRAYNAVYSDYNIYWENSKTYQLVKADRMEMQHPSCALVRRTAWNDIRVNEELTCRNGWDFWLKFKQRFLVGYIPEPLWNYRQHGNSLSQKKEALETEVSILQDNLKNLLEKRKGTILEDES